MPPSPEQISRAEARVGTELLPGVELERLLSVGALFDVYATDGSVLKLLHPEIDASRAELGRCLGIADEVEHTRALGISSDGDSDEGPYVLTRLVEGESLVTLALRRPGRIPPGEAIRIVSDATEVVLSAHQRTLVHGAISGSHVLLSQNGGVFLIGFGESRLRARARSPKSVDVASAFRAPELDRADAIPTPASDIWALGATLFLLLTGESPYGGPPTGARPGAALPRKLADVYPRAPGLLTKLVDRSLAADPDARFGDAGSFLAALRGAYELREIHYALPLRSPLTAEGDGAPPLVPSREPLSPPRLAPLPPMMSDGLPQIFTPPPPSDTHVKLPDWPRELQARATASTVPAPALFDPIRLAETEPPDAERKPPRLEGEPPPEGMPHRAPTTPIPVAHDIRVRTRADTHPAMASMTLAEPSPPSVRRRREADLLLGITTTDERETESLEKVLRALEDCMAVSLESGPDSAALSESLDVLTRVAEEELSPHPAGLACRIEADRITTQAGTVWEAPGALAGPVRRLNKAGVQTVALLPGIDRAELSELVAVFSTREGFGTDIATELYDGDFAHVLFHAPDPLAGFQRPTRDALEARQNQMLSLLDFDTSFQLEEAWDSGRRKPAAMGEPLADTLTGLSLAIAEAQTDALRGEPLERDSELDGTRLSHIIMSALEGPTLDPALAAFAPRLRALLEESAHTNPHEVLALVSQVTNSVRAPSSQLDESRQKVFRALSSPKMLETLFHKLAAVRADEEDLEGLGLLVPLLDAEAASVLVPSLPAIADERLRAQVLHHLEFGITGHETALGQLAQEANPELGLEIVRLLGRIETLAVRDGLELAAESPFAAVRLEALGTRDGASGERLRAELKRLLEDSVASERILTLRAICDHEIKFAAPYLALRVRSSNFDSLEYEEKRLMFNALSILAPARAEALALDLLDQNRLLSSGSHEDSRALAAETLGRIGSSAEVIEALAHHTRWRIRSSEKVRSAAQGALARVEHRLAPSEPPPRPSMPPASIKERPRDD